MNKAYLLTGGNIGNREANLATACKLIHEEAGTVVSASALYETAAWGKQDQPSFLNQALEIETGLSAKKLMQKLLEIEKKIGRERKEKYDPRVIDIDILLFENRIYNLPDLRVPHPELQNRRFALVPLVEIAENFIHPVLKKSIGELLNECPDKLEVSKFENDGKHN